MISFITAALGAVTGILGLIATHEANAITKEIVSLKNQILDELNKGITAADDGLLETLYAKLQIQMDAAQTQINTYIASRAH